MDKEIGKWYKSPGGGIYRINYAIKHPVDDNYYIQIERVPCIWDYMKRSIATKYEIKEFFLIFRLDLGDKTEQQIINDAYIIGMLINDSVLKLNELIKNKESSSKNNDIDKRDKIIQDFQFKNEEKIYRYGSLDELRDILDIDIMDVLQVYSPY
ncbi:hypothetical protein [Clostridium estertheticum]|uniref:hypothetical protein n=1 Tax=Clostridium estertheticum TaxID=238834 RepID=UPI001C0D52B2|nr:hypothetical protein [Clostridium estertheticum]MBU3186573.1 hypothetical protein [Clostridium estertheticum]